MQAIVEMEEFLERLSKGKPAFPRRTRSSGSSIGIPKRFMGTPPQQVVDAFFELLPTAKEWGEGSEGWPGYLIYGSLGVGKTGVSAMLATYLAQAFTLYTQFVLVWDLVSEIKSTWGQETEEDERAAIKKFLEPDLLVVDEVGVQFATLAERNILYRVVVGRHNDLKPTIITTNSDLDSGTGRTEFYEAVGVRVASRFEGFLINAGKWGGNLRSPK